MVFDVSKIAGIGAYIKKTEKREAKSRELYYKNDKVFLVINQNTIEVRVDANLRDLLVEKYESVMRSRYFGKGGIEIVLAGRQLEEAEIDDLVRLSYNLS